MKVVHWLVVAAVSFMVLSASLEWFRDVVVTGNPKILPVAGIALIVVIIIALLKMTKPWMVAAIFSISALLGTNVEWTTEYSIAISICTTTLLYLVIVLRKPHVLR